MRAEKVVLRNEVYEITRCGDEDKEEYFLEWITETVDQFGRSEPECLGYFDTRSQALQAAANHVSGQRWVNVFDVGRYYGGPEEGGWWYDAGECVDRKFAASVEEARKIRTELEAEYGNDGPGLGSVLSRGEYQVSIELLPSEGFSNYSPYQ